MFASPWITVGDVSPTNAWIVSSLSPQVGRSLLMFKHIFFLKLSSFQFDITENSDRLLNYSNFLGSVLQLETYTWAQKILHNDLMKRLPFKKDSIWMAWAFQ